MRRLAAIAPLVLACAAAPRGARAETPPAEAAMAAEAGAPSAQAELVASAQPEVATRAKPPDGPPPSAWEWMSEPDAPGATQKMVGWVATWLGVSITVLGGVSGVVALTEGSAAEEGCNEVRCFNEEALAHNDHAVDAARLADITVTTGLGILGVGLTVFLTASYAREPEVSLSVRPGGFALRGRF